MGSAMDRYYERQKKKKNTSDNTQNGSALDRYYERQRYNSIDTTGVDQKYIDSFMNDANTFLGSAEEEYGGLGWANASSSYEGRNTTWQDLNTRADTINAWLYKNRNNMDSEVYNNLSNSLSSFRSGGSSIIDSFKSASDFYGQFESEDAYNQWYEEDKKKKELLNQPDFEEYSKKGASIKNPENINDVADTGLFIFGKRVFGKDGEDVGNVVTMSRDNADYIALMEANGGDTADYGLKSIYRYMTDDEVGIYNYYLGKGDTESASKYLASLEDTLNQRFGGAIAENIKDRKGLEMLFGAASGLEQFAYGVKNLDNFFTGEEAEPLSAWQYAAPAVREDMDGLWGVAYDLTQNTANMLPSILVGSLTGGIGGTLTLGASAMGNAYADMKRLGYDDGASQNYAFLVGASEAALSYFLGGISNLGGKVSGNVVSKLVSKLDNALARTAITLGGNMASEGLEEAIQEVLDPVFKMITTGEDFEGIDLEQVLYSGLLGALSAGMLEGVSTVGGEIKVRNQGANLKKSGLENVTTLAELGKTFADGTTANRLGNKVNGDSSAYTVGRLLAEVGGSLSERNIADVASDLQAKGMSPEEATKTAKWLYKAAEGGTYSRKQQKAYMTDDRISDVHRDIFTNKENSVYKRNAEYDALYALAQKVSRGKATEATGEDVASVAKTSAATPTDTPTEKETATETSFKVSEDGKARLGDTEVSIKEIASIKNGEVMLRLDDGSKDGSTVKASEVTFSSNDEGLLYENVVDMGLNAVTANTFVKGFDGSMSVGDYVQGFSNAYRYGELGIPKKELSSDAFATRLTDQVKNLAYNHGSINAKYKATEQEKVNKSRPKADSKAKTPNRQKYEKKGEVHISEVKKSEVYKSLSDVQKAGVDGMVAFYKALGIDVYFFVSPTDAKGNRTGKNGYFVPEDGSVHIDLYAGIEGKGTILFTAGHELTHYIREKLPAQFKAFADILFDKLEQQGHPVAELIAKKKADLESLGRITPDMTEQEAYDLAYEETVADACESMLADGKAFAEISKQIKAKNKTLWEAIKEFFTNLVAKIRKAYEALNPDSVVGNQVAEMLETAEELRSMWVEMLVEASEISNIVEVDTKTKSVAPMLSERTWTASEYVTEREKTAKAIAKALNVDLNTAYKYIDDINSIARLIADDRARLDYDPNLDEKATVLKPNSEYKYTVDMSTLCAKRLLFTGTFDAIQKALPNMVFDSEDIVALREMMQKRGYEVACGICYVESTRREIGRITQEFIDRYKVAQKTGEPISRINSSGKEVVLKSEGRTFSADKNYTPNLGELNTTDIDIVKRDHREVYDAYLAFMNARGQAKPKLLETRAEYKGEILKHFKAKSAVNARNNAGGLRLQSFSDFEVPHLIDMMQIVMDMSRVGLKSQAYTKVPAFAEVFGNSGVKINLSLIAKGDGLDANGNLIFDDVEGINHKEAFALRDKYSKNVGTILVGKTDAHIIAAMADPRIDYIIPFHKSSWKESLYDALGLTGYADYTDTQNEKPLDKDRKIKNFDPSEYWDFTKSGDENAQIYLEKCREDGRIPKFPQFQGYPGYWKLLIDFKMYDNDGIGSPQEVVQPIFNTEASERILGEYKGGHKSFPVAKDVVEDFVKEHKDKVKYSDRDSNGNTLSKEQQGFFKDSKVRDKKGNLLVVYHGTTANFNTFKKGDVGFHFGTKAAARGRVGFGKNVTLKEVYLNITNPIVFDEDLGSWDADYLLTRELFDKGILTKEEAESVLFTDDRSYKRTTEAANKKLASVLLEKGYDGIIYSNTFETKKATTSYIVLKSNQAKEISNKTPTSNPDIRYSDRVTDKETLDFLNKQIEKGEYITTYKSMRLDDGKLHSPMATEINGKYENEYELGEWYQAVEHPELIKFDKKNGLPYFELDKGVDEFGDDLGKVPARYNPYEHSSNYVINDQFKTAFKRPNLVVVEMRIPLSETTSGYQAQYAKDSVGWQEWKKGDVASALAKKGKERKVLLSRWSMPVRILSDAEVAAQYKELLSGTGVTVPNNVVTPTLLKALEEVGVDIDYTGIARFEETYAKKAKEREAKKAKANKTTKYSDRVLMGSLFSGGGTLEAGLVYQMLDKEFAVENDDKIASAYTDNHGKEHMFVGDVREFNSKDKQSVFYLHASPVCKNFSPASHSGGETPLDILTAEATARVLEEQKPQVFTVENVKRYIGSEAYNIITNKLDELGYTWDVDVYKASDYGNATKRERMIIRAVRDGELPAKPQKASNITSWGEATRDLWETDLIPSTLVKSKIEAIKNTPQLKGVKLTKLDKPLMIYDTTKSKTITFAWADELAPTLTTKCGDARIIMPDGRVYAPTPKFMGRIQGLPDDYKYPKAVTTAFKIIGNGIPTQLTKAVIGGVLDSAYEQTHDGKVLYSDRYNDTAERAKEYFGTTNDPSKAGYMLADGTMLNFRNEGNRLGWDQEWFEEFGAHIDHHVICEVYGNKYDDNPLAAINKFISEGNVRLVIGALAGSADVVEISANKAPSKAQLDKIYELAEQAFAQGKKFGVSYAPENWDESGPYEQFSAELSPSRVISNIKYYYANGMVRGGSGVYRYSDRSTDSVSNRSLLANALESVAQNDIERNKLAEYKSKIALIESEQAKLAEIRGKIKELSFAKKENRDDEAKRKLQFEEKQIANRINTYDRQLLNLESTKALKGVLDREKQMAYKRAEQKGKEALKAQRDKDRERNAKTQRELLTRYQESRKKGIESRNKTEMRYKIKKVVNELNQYLKGTKEKHVPIQLQKPVAEALRVVNMDTVNAEQRIAHKQELMRIAANKGQMDKVSQLAKEIEHIKEMGEKLKAKLERLKTAYDSILTSEDPLVANSHDDVISNTIAKVIEVVGDTPVRDMSLGQLVAVYDMYKMVLTTIRNANKAFKLAKGEAISTIANGVIAELDAKKRKSPYSTKAMDTLLEFEWNNLKPVYAFERIGSANFTKVFNAVRAGEDVWAMDMREAEAFRDEQFQKHNYRSFDFEKKYDFVSSTGHKFTLRLGQIMSMYAYSKRGQQAKDHLKYGGFQFDGVTEVKEKKGKVLTVTYQMKDSTTYKISDELLNEIIGVLDEVKGAKAFVDEMQEYLSSAMGEKGNEVSLALYEVKLFKEKNYFPLRVSHDFLARAREQAQGDVKIKNKGFTKETTPNAQNPIVLSSFMDVWAGHVNEMSMYHAFTLPLEDFYRVYNYSTPTGDKLDTIGVVSSLRGAHRDGAVNYIDQLLKDLNGGARSDPREGIFNKGVSLFKKAKVMASLSVVVQQPTAIVRAMALVDAKYFVGKKQTNGKHKAKWEEIKKYAPVAVIKEMGYFDTGMGKGSVEWLKGDKTWKDKVDDVTSKLPALADEVTWVAIWNAVKRETIAKHKNLSPNSEEFLKICGERFTEVIVKTQVYDSTLSRSANMRSKNLFMKMLTAFMAEPTTAINMLADAFRKIKSNPKYFARTMGAVYGSVILNAALVSLVYAMRDDDEDETFAEKYASRVVTEIVDGINPLTYIPGVKDIWSAAQGFDVERADMSLVTEALDSFQQLVKVSTKDTSDMDEDELEEHYKSVAEAWMSVGDNITAVFGLPVGNVRRDIKGVINTFKTFGRDQQTTAGSLGDNIAEDLKDSIPVWGWFPDKSKGDKLYDAIMDGDKDYTERMKEYAEIEHFYTAAVEEGPIMAQAVKEVIISAKVAEGKTLEEAEESFINGVTSSVRKHYEDADITYNEAMDMLTEFCGLTTEEAEVKVQYWEYTQDNPDADVEASWFKKYNEDVSSSGISIDMYIDYRTKIKGIEGDKDNNGNTISGSRKAKVMAVINSLPISNAQKDALYFAEGWTASRLWEAPWH